MKNIILLILFLNLISFNLYCAVELESQTSVTWKVEDNFKNFLFKEDNVELIVLQNIPSFYEIKRKTNLKNKDVDLYLSFDKTNTLFDDTDNYKVSYKKYHLSENKSVYKKGGYFISDEDRIELDRTDTSFFQPGVNLGSFSITFWIYPVSFTTNEIIVKIGSQFYNKQNDNAEEQSIIGKIENGFFIWEFNNLFKVGKFRKDLLKLKSYKRIMPEKWTNINLCFDSFTGTIKEYIDGQESGIIMATEDGTIESSVLNMQYDPMNRCSIKIAQAFHGAIDEFYIIKNSNPVSADKYENGGGVLLSNVIELNNGGAFISKVKPIDIKNNSSDILYYYRYSDKAFSPYNDPGNDELIGRKPVKWHLLGSENLNLLKIRYIQWKIILLPGKDGEFSPKFKGLTVDFEKNLPPAKPIRVKIVAGDKSVKIKWIKNSEKDIKGYKVYYGTKSGNYFGEGSKLGASPVDVGLKNEIEIAGLKNNIIYYFVVTAYDDEKKSHESQFSEEIIARPLEQVAGK